MLKVQNFEQGNIKLFKLFKPPPRSLKSLKFAWEKCYTLRFQPAASFFHLFLCFCVCGSIPTIFTSIFIHSRSCKHTPLHIYTSFLSDDVRIQNEKPAIVIKRHQITLYQLFPATGCPPWELPSSPPPRGRRSAHCRSASSPPQESPALERA